MITGNAEYQLQDHYRLDRGVDYLSGTQALARLALVQRWRDAAAGLNTAGFVSGYRGSPLGRLDLALWDAKEQFAADQIHFEPGLNEDLAATAVWGSQHAGLFRGARHDGVFAMWYGKGPGVDRSCDALKHGNHAGAAQYGGVLALAGDDHGAKSSSLAHQSEHAFIHCAIPVLYPADIQDFLDFGILGWAMSRFAGCWTGVKCATDVVETSQTVDVAIDRVKVAVPDGPAEEACRLEWSRHGLELEQLAIGQRLGAAQRFVRANGLDRVVLGPLQPRLGIVTAGKAYGDVRQALDDLELGDEEGAHRAGLAVYKLAMTWPIEPEALRAFADGVDTLLVVEEKRPLIEDQIRSILYPLDYRPTVVGKLGRAGEPLLSDCGELDPDTVRHAIEHCLGSPSRRRGRTIIPLGFSPGLVRKPAFCAGCPHNTSTAVPEGSNAFGGIGCHTMATWMPERRTLGYSHMGGEGGWWIGISPFTDSDHVFQNVGDGTYMHSGSLAVRAAVAAGVNMTFKILVNGAVAMTGAQPIEGHAKLDSVGLVRQIVAQLAAEDVERVVVVTDDPARHRRSSFSPGTAVRHRDDLEQVQRELREVRGVTAIVYDQACAAETRRLRKRGRLPDPDRRVIINEAVCEGCGDCGTQSNCIAIEPVETEFGRKRRINQFACNKDDSCLKGYCPSFAVVTNGKLRAKTATGHGLDDLAGRLPPCPERLATRPVNVLVAGIGGTGVVTVGALIGMAARLSGQSSKVLDVTGLAQKNGAVASHIRIADDPEKLHSARIGLGSADVLIGCDIVVAASPDHLVKMQRGRTVAVVDPDVAPTADFADDPDLDLCPDPMVLAIRQACGEEGATFIEAASLTSMLLNDAAATNVFLLGFALQRGLLPVPLEAVERAIELNGVKVDLNRQALELGRLAAAYPDDVRAAANNSGGSADSSPPIGVAGLIDRFADHLHGYGGTALEAGYRQLAEQVAARDAEVTEAGPGRLTEAVARAYCKLLAYKDEYEVARLWSDPAFNRRLDEMFEPGYQLRLHLAPQRGVPAASPDGRFRKREFGPWVLPVFKVMARARFVRGSFLDFFGHTEHRRHERALITQYEDVVAELLAGLNAGNYDLAVQIAQLPEQIRGYGVIKETSLATTKEAEADLLARFRALVASSQVAPELHANGS